MSQDNSNVMVLALYPNLTPEQRARLGGMRVSEPNGPNGQFCVVEARFKDLARVPGIAKAQFVANGVKSRHQQLNEYMGAFVQTAVQGGN